MALPDAVAATRFHHQLPQGDLIRHDQREIRPQTRDGLTALGYRVQPNSWGDLGDVQAISIANGDVSAASDPRGRGVSLVLPAPAQ